MTQRDFLSEWIATLNRFDFVCISLKNRKDRQKHMEGLFRRLKILDRITWWLVDKHPTGGVYGCFESHLNVWKRHGNREFLFVFEDDINLVDPGGVIEFHNVLSCIPELDYSIINCAPSPLYITGSYKHGFDSGYFLDTAAYVIPRKHLPRVIRHVEPHFGIPIDIATFDLPSVGREIFRQIGDTSDILDGPYYAWRKETRESISKTFPGFGLIVITVLKLIRSDPSYRNEKAIPSQIVDRR